MAAAEIVTEIIIKIVTGTRTLWLWLREGTGYIQGHVITSVRACSYAEVERMYRHDEPNATRCCDAGATSRTKRMEADGTTRTKWRSFFTDITLR